jgi:FkbM family methyltransferase
MDLGVVKSWSDFQPKKILDIGCNVGQFYNLAKHYFPQASFFLIDGNESLREDLEKLNVPFKISLLSSEEKDVIFYKNPANPKCTGSSIYKETTVHYEKAIEEVKRTEMLDKLFPDETFDIIKLDTQGSEIDILKGGTQLMYRTKYIIVETSLIEWNLNSPKESDVIDFMTYHGFFHPKNGIIGTHYLNGKLIQQDLFFVNPMVPTIEKLV